MQTTFKNVRLALVVAGLALGLACSSDDPTTQGATGRSTTLPPEPNAAGYVTPAPAGGAPAAAPATTAERPVPSVTGDPAAPLLAASPTPAAPPRPAFRETTIPSGTALALQLETPVGSDQSRVEESVRARVTKPVVIDGVTVIPAGAELVGTVVEANQSGRVKGRASVAFRFHRMDAWGDSVTISTARIARLAEATKGEDATKVAVGGGIGAVIGGIAGGKKGAAIGGAVGAGAGTGAVLATRGEEVRLGAGAAVRATLNEPVTIRVPVNY